jgi:hypothetical protein
MIPEQQLPTAKSKLIEAESLNEKVRHTGILAQMMAPYARLTDEQVFAAIDGLKTGKSLTDLQRAEVFKPTASQEKTAGSLQELFERVSRERKPDGTPLTDAEKIKALVVYGVCDIAIAVPYLQAQKQSILKPLVDDLSTDAFAEVIPHALDRYVENDLSGNFRAYARSAVYNYCTDVYRHENMLTENPFNRTNKIERLDVPIRQSSGGVTVQSKMYTELNRSESIEHPQVHSAEDEVMRHQDVEEVLSEIPKLTSKSKEAMERFIYMYNHTDEKPEPKDKADLMAILRARRQLKQRLATHS